MIVLEGADCVGKTTLARKLAERLVAYRGGDPKDWRSAYRHMSRPPEGFDHLAGYIEDVTARVQDRYHLGSVVYGQMLGLGGYPTPARMRMVQRYLRWQGCVVVILHCQRDRLRALLDESTKAEMYDREAILSANEGFRALTRVTNRGVPYSDLDIDVTARWPDESAADGLVDIWRSRWIG